LNLIQDKYGAARDQDRCDTGDNEYSHNFLPQNDRRRAAGPTDL